MKTLYIDCNMGAAGDMLLAALLELHPDPGVFLKRLNRLDIPGVSITRKTAVKCGIKGTQIEVAVHGQHENESMYRVQSNHSHMGLHELEHIIRRLDLPQPIQNNILSVYQLIAEAESYVHGVPVEQIHFHEVGSMDAVADITGVCMLIEELAPKKIIASPVHVGCGRVNCAHGILPVPAPATAHILKGVPIYGGSIQGELCTPTGAALLKYFADSFGDMPVMRVSTIGYGMGSKDFETANCLRAMLGETEEKDETVVEMSCNIDDMTAEEISFAAEKMFQAGALEVFTIPIGMKKSRQGLLLCCLCKAEKQQEMAETIFKYTTTIGIRWAVKHRYTLDRTEHVLETPYGSVRLKRSHGYGVARTKTEYEDIARIADENGLSIREARSFIDKALQKNEME